MLIDHPYPMSLGSLRDAAIALGAQLVRRVALHDPLTGLPNRTLLRDRLGQALARARREGGLVAVLLLDLDGFKDINDTLGHPAGDRLLCAIGQRISAAVRATDTLARLGGDEFALVQPQSRTIADVAALADKVLATLAAPFDLDGQEVHALDQPRHRPVPAGRARPGHAAQERRPGPLPRQGRGPRPLRFFEPAMDEEAQARRRLERELRQALERGEFVLHYQPQLELATGRFTGVEALVRWNHPERGLVLPGRVHPGRRGHGLIRPLGEWVLREACRQAKAWRGARLAADRGGQPLAGAAAPDGHSCR